MDNLLTKEAWKSILERVLWTGIQVALGIIPAGVGIAGVDWKPLFSVVAVSMLVSLLKNVGAVLATGSPSTNNSEVLTPTDPGDAELADTEGDLL